MSGNSELIIREFPFALEFKVNGKIAQVFNARNLLTVESLIRKKQEDALRKTKLDEQAKLAEERKKLEEERNAKNITDPLPEEKKVDVPPVWSMRGEC